MTVIGDFWESAQRYPERVCLMEKQSGLYQAQSYREVGEIIKQVASALSRRGIRPGDRVALMSTNCQEWVYLDLGIQMAGGVTVPIYPTLTPSQVTYILENCDARLIAIENAELLVPLASHLTDLPMLEGIILLKGEAEAATSWQAFISEGTPAESVAVERTLQNLREEDLCSIVYTSGTTGVPKGVMLTHGNLSSNARILIKQMGITAEDRALSFLPLSHALERIVHVSILTAGGSLAYVESQASLAQNFTETNPTLMVCVPRLFEKLRNRMLENILGSSWVTKNLFFWGLRNSQRKREGLRNPWLSGKVVLADTLIFRQIRKKFGNKLRFFISGGASLTKEVAEFFSALGFEILEGYGLTETSPVIAVNYPGKGRIGTVGQVLPGVEVRLSEDGEILVKGPNVMQGYFKNPEATAEVLADGWFATGDIGCLDSDGYLSIVDRKKELLIMSNGKNVAPQPIENALKKSKYISMAMLVGDKRNYITALVVPNLDPLERFAKQAGIAYKTPQELLSRLETRELYVSEIRRLTADCARFEQVKDFAFAEEFTQENDELTPTLKYKRRVILSHYAATLEELYANAGQGESQRYSLHTGSTGPLPKVPE